MIEENKFLSQCYYIEKEQGSSALRRYLKKHWREKEKFPTNINLNLIKAYLSYGMRKGSNKNVKGLKIFFKTRRFSEKYFTKKFYTFDDCPKTETQEA